ncbi:MAG: VTC domain-containing protein [Halioglobus sp.]
MTLQPQCIISYHRRAFEGSRYEPGLRVTFDTHLKYRINDLDVTHLSKDRFFLPPDKVVMEIKIDERIPIWLTSFLAHYQCELKRVSKYCLGMGAGLGKLEDTRVLTSN